MATPSLFSSGIRPAIDAYLEKKSKEIRDYGDYWSASSAGDCMRKLIFERLGVPPVQKDSDARKTRVFEVGRVFHAWVQDITKNAGLSIAQELELSDDDLMVRGHIDDLVLIEDLIEVDSERIVWAEEYTNNKPRLILYDYKTQHANAFTWQKGRPVSYYHKMQIGTYMYMLRSMKNGRVKLAGEVQYNTATLTEARILKISKDDLRMDENQVLWDAQLEKEVLDYWTTLNKHWADKKLPKCTCADHEGGFRAKEKSNPYFYNGQPCSIDLYQKWKEK